MKGEKMEDAAWPKDKLRKYGPEALSDSELLSIVCDVDIAKVRGANLDDVKLSPLRSLKLQAARELGRRESRHYDPRPVLDSPAKVAEHVPMAVKKAHRENFLGFYLNARSQLLHVETISIGTLSASLVHPREVFAPALTHCAAALAVVHNHPSGDCAPSAEDKAATKRLAEAGQLLGIPLLDHVIVSATGYRSLKEDGCF
jgi:DNA repair protein RadC